MIRCRPTLTEVIWRQLRDGRGHGETVALLEAARMRHAAGRAGTMAMDANRVGAVLPRFRRKTRDFSSAPGNYERLTPLARTSAA